MERTRHLLLTGKNYWSLNRNSPVATYWKPLTTKASNRAAVHGVKPPVPDIIDIRYLPFSFASLLFNNSIVFTTLSVIAEGGSAEEYSER